MFDYAILSSCGNKAEASQIAGRLSGNIKYWENYKPPVVFTTLAFDKVATEKEEQARRLAESVWESKEAGDTTCVKKSEFATLGGNYTFHREDFASMVEVNAFLSAKTTMEKMGIKKARSVKDVYVADYRAQCGGYAVATRHTKGGHHLRKKAEKTFEDRLFRKDLEETDVHSQIVPKKGKIRVIANPFYEDENTPADEEKYELRWSFLRIPKT